MLGDAGWSWVVTSLKGLFLIDFCSALKGLFLRRLEGLSWIDVWGVQVGLWGYSSYSASKFALRGMAQALQMEVRHDDIETQIDERVAGWPSLLRCTKARESYGAYTVNLTGATVQHPRLCGLPPRHRHARLQVRTHRPQALCLGRIMRVCC